MSDNSIDVKNLRVRYGDLVALEDATLHVDGSRVCGLVGTNGSGKSTLFKAMMGILTPDSGEVSIGGLTPQEARNSNLVGYVPQSEEVDWTFPLRVWDVVMMGRYGHMGFFRRIRQEDKKAVEAALERVDLLDLAERQIGELSGGQKKRAFVARGLAQGAKILFLDEPFSGVDKVSEGTITRLLQGLAKDGATVIVSTHDLAALPKLASEAILLQRRVLMHADTATILQPENLAMAFGTSEVAP
ncbi:metal ABC transporter ATP-binding protein [Actinomycetaceae bacterium TAE3-ERU4]|nr:metal ABC transporter ATP-binding protein [Actinomycetaceae bacterium TAE3-ERU4]